MQDKRAFFKKKDIIILAVLLIAAAAGFAVYAYMNRETPDKLYAEIYYGSSKVKMVYLDKDTSFSLLHNPQVKFEVKDGAISFTHSDCPDQLCVEFGWMAKNGDFAACLPNQVLVWVNSENNAEADIGVGGR